MRVHAAAPFLLLLAVLVTMPATADGPSLVGTVVSAADGRPLAGARIALRGRLPGERMALQATAPDGGFAIDPAAVLSPEALDGRVLTLTVERQGFRPWSRKIIGDVPGRFAWKDEVALVPQGGLAGLSPEEERALRRFVSSSGRTLIMVPFALIALADAPSEEAFNALLRTNLHRGIKSYLQRADFESLVRGVGIVALAELSVSATNTERLVAIGRFLNALGVIAGDVLVTDDGDDTAINVVSGFHVIPTASEAVIAEVSVEDRLGLADLTSIELYRKLSPLWGRATLIAVALSEMEQAKRSGDVAALERILGFVASERANIGPDNNDFEREILALVEQLEQAIADARGNP